MRALIASCALLGACAVCEPHVVDVRPAIEACLAKGMLPGAVQVDKDGKLVDALCLEVRLKRRAPDGPDGSDS